MSSSAHVFTRIRKGSNSAALADKLLSGQAMNPGKNIKTIGGLIEAKGRMDCTCLDCDRKWSLEGEGLLAQLGSDEPLSALKPECPNCQSKKTVVMPVFPRS